MANVGTSQTKNIYSPAKARRAQIKRGASRKESKKTRKNRNGGGVRGKGTLTISLRTNKKLRPFASSFFEFIASYFIDTVQSDEHEGKPLQTKNGLHQREKFLANKKRMVNVNSKTAIYFSMVEDLVQCAKNLHMALGTS